MAASKAEIETATNLLNEKLGESITPIEDVTEDPLIGIHMLMLSQLLVNGKVELSEGIRVTAFQDRINFQDAIKVLIDNNFVKPSQNCEICEKTKLVGALLEIHRCLGGKVEAARSGAKIPTMPSKKEAVKPAAPLLREPIKPAVSFLGAPKPPVVKTDSSKKVDANKSYRQASPTGLNKPQSDAPQPMNLTRKEAILFKDNTFSLHPDFKKDLGLSMMQF